MEASIASTSAPTSRQLASGQAQRQSERPNIGYVRGKAGMSSRRRGLHGLRRGESPGLDGLTLPDVLQPGSAHLRAEEGSLNLTLLGTLTPLAAQTRGRRVEAPGRPAGPL